ncbi:hypothetical protein BaRGS_00021670 [Batillaria attramentaria]|uniref:Kinase n=1 Tax=Batillaria attramentaria TaxID=370345 RepID=A0ABD0KJG1_9CAEN
MASLTDYPGDQDAGSKGQNRKDDENSNVLESDPVSQCDLTRATSEDGNSTPLDTAPAALGGSQTESDAAGKRDVQQDDDSTDEGSDWEAPVDVELTDKSPPPEQTRRRRGSWKSVRALTKWVSLSRIKYPWTQMAGHQGSFLAGSTGTILKLLVTKENDNLPLLMAEPQLGHHVPKYHGAVEKDGTSYVQLQDLLCKFTSPCVMDIKMGVRTYLEEELEKARKKPTLRKDLYQKMISVDATAPTEEEQQQEAVTKPRYMRFRDDMSSTSSLGFRIEGIKTNAGSSKDYKDTRSRESVCTALRGFIGDTESVLPKYISALSEIAEALQSSNFFKTNEMIGTSLLFVHDRTGKAGVWLIDFAKCTALPDGVSIDHRSTWVEGNYEDGYLFGLDNLISIFQELHDGFSNAP